MVFELPAMPNSARGQRLPALPVRGRAESSDDSESAGASHHAVLPVALSAALDAPLAMLALEDWHRTHRERPGQHVDFDSELLSCEARLRKLDNLSRRLRPPNLVVTGVVIDLLRRVLSTLPPALRSLSSRLMQFVEGAVYSQEPASGQEVQQLQEILGHSVDRLPFFVLVKRQQTALARLEARAAELQQNVDEHMAHRRSVLEFIARLQQDERLVLQRWLFRFWVMTFNHRRFQISKVATSLLTTPQDIVTPFLSWRLWVSELRLERAKAECDTKDKEASAMANRITEVEIENEDYQRQLEASLNATAALKAKCVEEQSEHERLQELWDATQPELLLSVLTQALDFVFSLVMRTARFSGPLFRKRFANKDVSPLLDGFSDGADELLVRWLNWLLQAARATAAAMAEDPELDAASAPHLDLVAAQGDITNLADDMSDSVVLCMLFAACQAEEANRWLGSGEGGRDRRGISPGDLWSLGERDLELRAEQVWQSLSALAPTGRARSLLVPLEIVEGNAPRMREFLASIFLRYPMLPELPADLDEEDAAQRAEDLEKVLSAMEQAAGASAADAFQDPTPLLHGGEDFQALATVSDEQLLLRWANVQLSSQRSRQVENFGSDLQDGEAIGRLLSTVAPETMQEDLAEDPEERIEQILGAAHRCVDFELLSASAILEGQSDMLAAFFAQLFLVRPNLAAKQDSLLAMHLRLLEDLCVEALNALANPGDSSRAMAMCVLLDERWSEFILAIQTVQMANNTMQSLTERIRTLLGDVLAHRAYGKPKAMLDAKEAREFMLYTSISLEQIAPHMAKDAVDSAGITRVEELLRKHFRLLRDVYRHYSTMATGVTLEGLMKLYQDCKLRTRDLAPHHLEGVFCDHVDATSGDRSLTSNQFVLVLLRCAHLRFREKVSTLSEQFSNIVEHHLKPYSCREDTQSIFMRMAYDPKVRKVLDLHSKELRIIFLLYAMMDTSTADAMQRVHTMNLKEFQMLLTDTSLLDDTLTEEAMQSIFDGIQTSAMDDTTAAETVAATAASAKNQASSPEQDEGEAGDDDDEELSFTEFLDGLVAIAPYKYPDPFTPFEDRVNSFILELFGLLRKHWSRRRISPQVDAMLNALQKKMRKR